MIDIKNLKSYYNVSEDFRKTKNLILKIYELKKIRKPFYLERANFEEILKWKLRNQYGRKKRYRDKRLSDDIIKKITSLALNLDHENEEFEIEYRLKLLSVLPGVDIPVASSILTLCFPEKYGVLDFRVWRTLFPKKR